jgi:hypothetical protein
MHLTFQYDKTAFHLIDLSDSKAESQLFYYPQGQISAINYQVQMVFHEFLLAGLTGEEIEA